MSDKKLICLEVIFADKSKARRWFPETGHSAAFTLLTHYSRRQWVATFHLVHVFEKTALDIINNRIELPEHDEW